MVGVHLFFCLEPSRQIYQSYGFELTSRYTRCLLNYTFEASILHKEKAMASKCCSDRPSQSAAPFLRMVVPHTYVAPSSISLIHPGPPPEIRYSWSPKTSIPLFFYQTSGGYHDRISYRGFEGEDAQKTRDPQLLINQGRLFVFKETHGDIDLGGRGTRGNFLER